MARDPSPGPALRSIRRNGTPAFASHRPRTRPVGPAPTINNGGSLTARLRTGAGVLPHFTHSVAHRRRTAVGLRKATTRRPIDFIDPTGPADKEDWEERSWPR